MHCEIFFFSGSKFRKSDFDQFGRTTNHEKFEKSLNFQRSKFLEKNATGCKCGISGMVWTDSAILKLSRVTRNEH